jgi:hypothetical protein
MSSEDEKDVSTPLDMTSVTIAVFYQNINCNTNIKTNLVML